MNPEPIPTRTAQIWLRVDGLIHLVYFPNSWDTLTDAQEHLIVIGNIQPLRRRPFLVDMRPIRGIDQDARAYYSGAEAARFATAVALLVESPVTRVMANFFIRLNQPTVPTRLFTSEDEAVAWLQGFIE